MCELRECGTETTQLSSTPEDRSSECATFRNCDSSRVGMPAGTMAIHSEPSKSWEGLGTTHAKKKTHNI